MWCLLCRLPEDNGYPGQHGRHHPAACAKARIEPRDAQCLAIYPAHKDEEFDAYVERLNELDCRLRALRVQTPNYQGHRHQHSTPKDTTNSTTASGTNAGPMDLSAGAAKTCSTAVERARRRALGLCMYCGGIGHFAADFPQAKARPVGKRRAITAAAATGSAGGVITTIDSEDDSDSDKEGKWGAQV